MADPNARDAKLIQYMQEAYGKEQELETALQADILLTTKDPYKKRLKQHLKETKGHAKALDRRIKKLGGGGHAVQTLVGKATAMAKAPAHIVRGSGEAEKMLKNAKTQFTAEAEEISTYLALEHFATKVGDSETAKLARDIRREEERMASFLESQIKQLSAAVALSEVPANLRRRASGKATKRRSAKSGSKSAAKPAASSGKKSASKSSKKSAKKTVKKAAKKASAKKAAAKTSAKRATKKASAARKGAKASAKKAGTGKSAKAS
jgi:ferritin-like metal-binding protein YciE